VRPSIQYIVLDTNYLNPLLYTIGKGKALIFYEAQFWKIMLQHDERYPSDTCKALSRCRPLDDSDASIIANTSKRQRFDQNTLSNRDDGHSEDKQCGMDVTMDDEGTSRDDKYATITTLSPDEILIQMVQSGCYSQDDVVNFCMSSGIPLSRMLRLDLMRLSNNPKR
jgi:hypothetical protein